MSAQVCSVTPYRNFTADDDSPWTAWDVIPSWGERRRGERRSVGSTPPSTSGERRRVERRRIHGIRVALSPQLANGWLAFESGESRRRLAPIPKEWHELPEEQLRE